MVQHFLEPLVAGDLLVGPLVAGLLGRIDEGLLKAQNGVAAFPLEASGGLSQGERVKLASEQGAERTLVVVLNMWHTTTFLNSQLSFDVVVDVMDGQGNRHDEHCCRGGSPLCEPGRFDRIKRSGGDGGRDTPQSGGSQAEEDASACGRQALHDRGEATANSPPGRRPGGRYRWPSGARSGVGGSTQQRWPTTVVGISPPPSAGGEKRRAQRARWGQPDLVTPCRPHSPSRQHSIPSSHGKSGQFPHSGEITQGICGVILDSGAGTETHTFGCRT